MTADNTIAVIGDIHGCFNTLKKIYTRIESIKSIYSVGDLIDRGKYSREVVQFCIDKSISPVKGNHEDMLIKAVDNSEKLFRFMLKDAKHYYSNGGRETQFSYTGSRMFSDFKKFSQEIKASGHYEYLKNLPLKYDIRKVMISHAGIIEGGNDVSILWNRDTPAFIHQLQIFGHTPHKEMIHKKNYYANIDTGCVYENKLTAVIVDTVNGKIEETIQVYFDPHDID